MYLPPLPQQQHHAATAIILFPEELQVKEHWRDHVYVHNCILNEILGLFGQNIGTIHVHGGNTVHSTLWGLGQSIVHMMNELSFGL